MQVDSLSFHIGKSPNQHTTLRTLQDIILTLSKITAGRLLAMTTLFFLSALAHQPILYKNFTEVDYKTVISVILPYTDPIK